VVIGDRCVDALAPRQREVGIVFQNHALFPHLTVADNVAYGLAARGVARSAQRAPTAEMLELVQMAALAERLPRELSGGQQQRVALALQQGQIDISPGNFNAIQILKARGVPVEFVNPEEGTTAFKTTAHVVKNSPDDALGRLSRGLASLRIPPPGCSLQWYQALIDAWQLHCAAGNSLKVAAAATVLSVVLGVGGAMGISRSATWTAHGLDSLFMSPLVLPALAFGLSALIHFSWLGLQVSMTTLVIGIRWSECPTW
jgi:hypothetical protein